jgi:hypothetical protein
MKTNLLLAILATASLSFLASCGEDEPKPADINFEFSENEVTESDGKLTSFHPELIDDGVGREIEVKIKLNRRAPGNIVIKFDVDGDARLEATADDLNDFEILEEGEGLTVDDDEITILKGTTEATLKILVFEDVEFEYEDHDLNDDGVPYETITITLEDIVSGSGKLGTELEHTLRILEDDAVAILQWEAADFAADAQDDAQVDMDILFWLNGESLPWYYAAQPGYEWEGIWIPAGFGEGDFGVSYTYYSGLSDNLNFYAFWLNTAGTLNGERYTYEEEQPLSFQGNYKLVNINTYDQESGDVPKIAQTMDKSGVDYSNFSGISPFDAGSRVKENTVRKISPIEIKRMLTELSRKDISNMTLRSIRK